MSERICRRLRVVEILEAAFIFLFLEEVTLCLREYVWWLKVGGLYIKSLQFISVSCQ